MKYLEEILKSLSYFVAIIGTMILAFMLFSLPFIGMIGVLAVYSAEKEGDFKYPFITGALFVTLVILHGLFFIWIPVLSRIFS